MSVVEFIRPELDRKEWAARISAAWQKNVIGILEVGRLLIRAKGPGVDALPHGEFTKMVDRDLPFGLSTSEKLMTIAWDSRISKSEFIPILPNSWAALYEVSKLSDQQFTQAVAEGVINTEMQPKDLRVFRRKLREQDDKALAETIIPSFAIHHCGIEEVTSDVLADASVDAIITDPPYPPEFLPTFSHLTDFAERTLKPGGWCVVMTGAVFLPEVINRLCAKLTYRWQYVITTPGGANARMGQIGLFQSYKPVLLFQKPPVSKIREWWSDVIATKAREQDKSLHPWQQSEPLFAELVNRFTRPGELVVDPFAGSGTTGRAAIAQGRHFWGCDIDEKCAT